MSQSRVKIEVPVAVAEWLLEQVEHASVAGCNGSYMVWSDLQQQARAAIESGLRYAPRRPDVCAHCGQPLYQSRWGRPALYCSDACRQAGYRERNGIGRRRRRNPELPAVG